MDQHCGVDEDGGGGGYDFHAVGRDLAESWSSWSHTYASQAIRADRAAAVRSEDSEQARPTAS